MRILRLCALLPVAFVASCGGDTLKGGSSESTQTSAASTQQEEPRAGATVFIGDSITEHWQDYKSFPAGAIDEGVSGQVCSQMLARFDTDVLAQRPAVVHILCGTTDLRCAQPGDPAVASAETSLFAMVELAKSAGAQVIVGTLPPDTQTCLDAAASAAPYEEFNGDVRSQAAAYGYRVADYYPALLLPDGAQNPSLFSDGLNPDAAGFAAMTQVFDQASTRTL